MVKSGEQIVQQKCIKEVWYTCMENLHHMLLPMLKWEHGDHASSSIPSMSLPPHAEFPLHNYTHRQCSALEIMMEIYKVG